MEETTILKREQPSKCEALGVVIAFGAIGFWFGTVATLAVKMVQSVDKLISTKCQQNGRRKSSNNEH